MNYSLSLSEKWYNRLLLLLGHAFFLTYLAGCLFFYKERLLNFDSAYYTFHLLFQEDYFIKHGRWISYLTQFFPMMVMEQGGSLATFLQTYSASFGLWFYLLFLLVVYGFKNVTGGVFYALAMGLTIRYKYYAAISEITFSLALGAVLIAWLTSKYRPVEGVSRPWFWGVALVLIVFLLGTHPVIIAPLLVFFAFDIAYHKRWRDIWNWGFVTLVLAIYAYTFMQLSASEYESERMGVLTQLSAVLQSPADFHVVSVIRRYFDADYAFPAALLGVVTLLMLWHRQWLSAIVFLLGNIAWLLINLGTYSYLDSDIFIMIDGYLALFGLIWAVPLLLFVMRSNYRTVAFLTVASLLIFSSHRIHEKHKFFTNRLELLQQTMDDYAEKGIYKVRFNTDHFDWHQLWYPYQVPHETLMLSAIEGPEHAKTIYVNHLYLPEEYFEQEEQWGFLHYDHHPAVSRLPEQYFKLPEGRYPLASIARWLE